MPPDDGGTAISLRARILVQILKWTVKRRLARGIDLSANRAVADKALLPTPRGVAITPDRPGGVPGEWVTAEGAKPGRGAPILMYIHGGAYITCSPRTHRPLTGAFARQGFRVFAPDYRLAPEHPFPAAVDDVVAAYRGLVADGIDPARLVLAGESAGGGLVLALLLRLRDERLPLPAAAVTFSPWTDLAATGASLVTNSGRDAMFRGIDVARAAKTYLGEADPQDPFASPLYANLAALPPLMIQVGEDEALLDDSTRLALSARQYGVEVEISVWPAVPHAWPVFQGLIPEARQSVELAAAFLKRKIAEGGRGPGGNVVPFRRRPVPASPKNQAARSRA